MYMFGIITKTYGALAFDFELLFFSLIVDMAFSEQCVWWGDWASVGVRRAMQHERVRYPHKQVQYSNEEFSADDSANLETFAHSDANIKHDTKIACKQSRRETAMKSNQNKQNFWLHQAT